MIVDYYLGKAEDSNSNTVNDYLSFDDERIAGYREYVPWVFPSAEASPGYVDAPVMDQEVVAKFKEDSILREMVRQVVNRYLKYLNGATGWRNSADPDHIRITRMIRFLATIGMKEEAQKVAKWCSERGGGKRVKATWESSVEYLPPWERKEEKVEEKKEGE
jgi:hypothetical protein